MQVVYKITVRKLIHGFIHLRKAFNVPAVPEGRELDCLKDVSQGRGRFR